MNFSPADFSYDHPVDLIIQQRTSVRTYSGKPIPPDLLEELDSFLSYCRSGPLGNTIRVKLTATSREDAQELQGLGTYGFISDPSGFIIGTVQDDPGALEDFGYLLEAAVLRATDLGLGTCWLGGTFNRSRFAENIDRQRDEIIPCVISLGLEADAPRLLDTASRWTAGSDRRLPWSELFFEGSFENPLLPENAGAFKHPLEMLRLAPSASNKQPWRILIKHKQIDFFLKRTPNYPSQIWKSLLKIADMQRVDMGIAMAHFELTALEEGRTGQWVNAPPQRSSFPPGVEYITSWKASS